MPKNFFRKIKESMMPTGNDGKKGNRSSDFERAKDILFSVKNVEQLISAVKYINNFNKKYGLGTKAPEFIYFDRMIKVMKVKLRSKRFEVGDNPEDSERMDLRGRIRESLDDIDWIKDTQPTKLDFNFDEKEYWVDVSKIDIEGRKKIVDYIKKTVPYFREFGGNELNDTINGYNKGLIIHCGSDRTDYEPEENLICYSNVSYEDDYEIDNPYADISKSIYVNGQDILDYLSVIGDEEELEESLEWTDKDGSFDGKDKSFEADPTWTGDDDWAPNPERSYWKQGDAGSSGGDVNESEEDPFKWMKDVEPDDIIASGVNLFSDEDMYNILNEMGFLAYSDDEMSELAINLGYRWSEKHDGWYDPAEITPPRFYNLNESQDLDWIRNVSDQLPSYNQRTRIDLKDFLLDYAEDNLSVIDFLHNEDLYVPTEDYRRRYTPEEWDEHGTDQWRDGDFKEHGRWIDDDPWVTSYDIIEELEMGCSKWEFIDRTTEDYDLERGSYDDLFIFKRKKDERYFALGVRGDSYDGMNDNEDFLYEVFPRMKLVYESRKNLIKKILRESDWEWAKEIPGTKEYGQEYRYFEIIACYDVDWETDECDDEYSHFVKIPKNVVDEIWNIPDSDFDYLAGPGDEGQGVIMYAIKNQLISHFDINEIIMFQGVREVDEETGMMHLEESKKINESDWDWLGDTREHPNYNGHPQGIVKIYDHDEIDRIFDVIDNYNGFPAKTDRSNLHRGLEYRRDELEQMSAEDDFDYGEAMLSVTFFVEKEPKGYGPNALSVGYWSYEVDERDIEDWLAQDDTYNREYEKYDSIEQVENLFKDYQKPE
jgi:hypothetical protein